MKHAAHLSILIVAFSFAFAQGAKTAKTDAEIKQAIINESIASYRGNCPCPYNRDRAGHSCGQRECVQPARRGSANLLRGRYHPAEDITQKMVDEYRKRTQ